MSDIEDSTDNVREAAIGVLTALLYSIAVIKGDNDQEQLSNFIDVILKSMFSVYIYNLITIYFYTIFLYIKKCTYV